MLYDKIKTGNRIEKERKFLGKSREQFAEILDLSTYFIGQIERGQRSMSLETLINISNCLHVSLDYLIFGENVINNDIAEIDTLIKKCTQNELNLIIEIIKNILFFK